MIEASSKSHEILTLKVTGQLTERDLDDLVPILQRHVQSSKYPHLLIIMKDFRGWEDAAAVWEDLKLDVTFIGYFNRIAIVGDQKWQQWGTQLVNPITKEELRFFAIGETDQAWEWLENKSHK